jgi:hypothetical protein
MGEGGIGIQHLVAHAAFAQHADGEGNIVVYRGILHGNDEKLPEILAFKAGFRLSQLRPAG